MVSEVVARPVGTLGGGTEAGTNVATAACQSVAELNVARASWVPAVLPSTYSRSADPALVCVPIVKGWPWEVPGVTVPGCPPVMMPPTTSSPAPAGPVAPESTEVLLPLSPAD